MINSHVRKGVYATSQTSVFTCKILCRLRWKIVDYVCASITAADQSTISDGHSCRCVCNNELNTLPHSLNTSRFYLTEILETYPTIPPFYMNIFLNLGCTLLITVRGLWNKNINLCKSNHPYLLLHKLFPGCLKQKL